MIYIPDDATDEEVLDLVREQRAMSVPAWRAAMGGVVLAFQAMREARSQ
jgi:hypothetical protein